MNRISKFRPRESISQYECNMSCVLGTTCSERCAFKCRLYLFFQCSKVGVMLETKDCGYVYCPHETCHATFTAI
jgi:hypothetical protein